MMFRLLASVAALEKVSRELQTLDPGDPAAVEPVLRERAKAIADLAGQLGEHPEPVSEDLFRRLEACLALGTEAVLRIQLARERARSDLSHVRQELQLLRGLRLEPAVKPAMVDCSG